MVELGPTIHEFFRGGVGQKTKRGWSACAEHDGTRERESGIVRRIRLGWDLTDPPGSGPSLDTPLRAYLG